MTAETGRAQAPDPAMGISELVRRWRAERPEQRALIDGATVLTWAELDAATTRAARGLLAAGLSAGDRLAHGDGPDPAGDRHGPETAVVLYTSGTSGRPRGAMLSTAALLANLEQMSAVQPPLMRGDDVGYVPVPLFHIFGLNVGLGMT